VRQPRRLCVGVAQLRCFGDGFQFGRFELSIEASIEQHEKSEASGFDRSAVAGPRVRFLAGGIVEPVAGVGKVW